MTDKTVFLVDIGNVLLSWDPDPLLRELNDAGPRWPYMEFKETFMVLNHGWDSSSLAEGIEKTAEIMPVFTSVAQGYRARFQETLPGLVEGTVEIVEELKASGYRLYLASNWARDAFEETVPRMTFLPLFDGRMISGYAGIAKPDHAFFEKMMMEFDFKAGEAVFIDDSRANVDAARALGIDSILFENPEQLRAALVERCVLAS